MKDVKHEIVLEITDKRVAAKCWRFRGGLTLV